MRPLLMLLLTVLAQGPSPGPAGGDRASGVAMGAGMDLQEARRRVQAGQHRVALAAAESWLATHPAAHPSTRRAAAVRAEALAAMGRCAAAAGPLRALRGTPAWSARLAVLEGECALVDGDLSTAEAAFDEALRMRPDGVGALHGRARVHGLRGEATALEAALQALAEHPDAGRRADVLRVQLALDTGAPEIDRLLFEFARSAASSERAQTRQHAQVLDGRRWLDVGDPATAEARFAEAAQVLPGRVFASVYRAEALRRLGQAAGSEMLLSQRRIREHPTAHAQAVRVRVLVDLGRLEEARSVLSALPAPAAPDALASAWYLARADGRAADTQALAARWRDVVPTPDRTLDQLVPISETP